MMNKAAAAAWWWWWCCCWWGAGAAPASDLIIGGLPGQPPASFRQYAGYIPIDAAAGRSFFYYFAEAQTHPHTKPLTLWLNGGPGCSSIGNGAFTENGPFRVSSESGVLVPNPFSWNRVSNVLYLDSPAGVGWSYSNTSSDLITNDTATAHDNFVFLQNWFDAFPEYKGREFFITGESYAGHYAPQLVALIVDYIHEAGTVLFNFIAMAIGNPLLNGPIDFEETVFFQWTHGMVSDDTYTAVIANCNFSNFATLTDACALASAELDREVSDFTDPYDVLIDVCLPPASSHQSLRLKQFMSPRLKSAISSKGGPLDICIDDELVAYMNLVEVQQAFHANTTGLPYRWFYCNEGSLNYDESSEDDSMLPILGHILEAGVRILVYSGDEDTVIPFGGTRRQIHELARLMNLNTTVPYSAWFEGGQVGGWTQVYGPLSYATVRGAAHMVPYSNPARALTLFQSFLTGVSMPLWPPTTTIQHAPLY